MPAITIPVAVGISVTIGYLTKNSLKHEEEVEEKPWPELIKKAFMKPLVALLIGWGVSFFI